MLSAAAPATTAAARELELTDKMVMIEVVLLLITTKVTKLVTLCSSCSANAQHFAHSLVLHLTSSLLNIAE
jgi:hypothetical protein